ncbi:Chitinase [Leptomonas pyrrhocoris]|uniref:Chitinase n=1 Tax=Leptomonas pyrrhocoris TaxID=157538 RepID=A0A0M9FXG9_LEPPY|nr:Chitinase [Leptomonas pyrrhocoris]XP_015656326.1 Chitinase [Leptomonas pyrrhocoris]XP_015656327.1 Chitinase [Leptomonas pyrrhocoris]KPA77886.1 Chitinase [Leptomonas pyrrhocoris]KPA77887.1 Chitinase [Leptomonas pyrrhocoris]KPA77888.1 Chitinase [Leptomonas pyrrhocoris]|eukprot:XP_015656325.1 Chitinase [Leptomonas pyrrhocoris]
MCPSGKCRDSGNHAASFLLVLTAALLCIGSLPTEAQRSEPPSVRTAPATTDAARSSSSSNSSAAPPFAVFGYLPEYRQLRFDYEAFFRSGLTHLIFFSAEVDPTSLQLTHVDDRLPSREKWKTLRELADTYGVKLLLCIGGGGRSAGFPRLVGDVLGRRRFVSEVGRVLHERDLDGVDFNWEYPSSMPEWLNFGQFLTELRSALNRTTAGDHHGRRVGPALITMALHPHPRIPHVLRVSHVLPSLDYLHWMAYDHIIANDSHSSVAYAASVLQDDVIGDLDDAVYNARLKKIRRQAHGEAEEDAPQSRKPHEADHRRKLCLGIPFYGRHRADGRVPPETYEHLWQFLRQWAGKRHPDWVEGGPELRSLSEYAGYDYNGYDDVRRKMRLARSSGIAGIMIWELGQDVPPGTSPMSLMTAVQEQLAEWDKDTASNADESDACLRTPARLEHTRENATRLVGSDDADEDL